MTDDTKAPALAAAKEVCWICGKIAEHDNHVEMFAKGNYHLFQKERRHFPAAPARQDAPAGILTFVVDQESEAEWDVNVWIRTAEPTLSKFGELIGWFSCESRQDAERVCERFKRLYSDVSAKQSLPDSPTPDAALGGLLTTLSERDEAEEWWDRKPKGEQLEAIHKLWVQSNLGAPGAGQVVWRSGIDACDSTSVRRFAQTCACPTYASNWGPCGGFEQGGNGRCVYCDHEKACCDNVKELAKLSGPGAGQAGSADDADLFNFYTRLNRGYIFSARMRIVKAMQEAMLAAEAKESPILSASPSEPKAAPEECEKCGGPSVMPGLIQNPQWTPKNNVSMRWIECTDPFHKAGTAPETCPDCGAPMVRTSEPMSKLTAAQNYPAWKERTWACLSCGKVPSESPRHVVFTDGMDDQQPSESTEPAKPGWVISKSLADKVEDGEVDIADLCKDEYCRDCRQPVKGSVHVELVSGAKMCFKCFKAMDRPSESAAR